MRIGLAIDPQSLKELIDRHQPDARRMMAIAMFVQNQAFARIDTAGASGGVSWPRLTWPRKAGTASPLADTHSWWHRRSGKRSAVLFSDFKWVKTHEFGATIRPVRAKALFVPFSRSASEIAALPPMRNMRTGKAVRRQPTRPSGSLVYGRDYLLLQKVEIPARPTLPTSQGERSAAAQYALRVLAEPPDA